MFKNLILNYIDHLRTMALSILNIRDYPHSFQERVDTLLYSSAASSVIDSRLEDVFKSLIPDNKLKESVQEDPELYGGIEDYIIEVYGQAFYIDWEAKMEEFYAEFLYKNIDSLEEIARMDSQGQKELFASYTYIETLEQLVKGN